MVSHQPVLVKLLDPHAWIPTRATVGSAGFDLYSCEEADIDPGKYKSINTGVAVEIPHGYFGMICGRSGLAFHKEIFAFNGIVDGDFRAALRVLLKNDSATSYKVKVSDRIAQLVIIKIHDEICMQETSKLSVTVRDAQGFGSTDKKN